MWGVRRQVSLLFSNGHSHARHYPIGMVWDEAELVVECVNRHLATEAVLIQLAVSSVLDKKSRDIFNKKLKELSGG